MDDRDLRLQQAETILRKLIEGQPYLTPQHAEHEKMVHILKVCHTSQTAEVAELLYAYYVRWHPDLVKP